MGPSLASLWPPQDSHYRWKHQPHWLYCLKDEKKWSWGDNRGEIMSNIKYQANNKFKVLTPHPTPLPRHNAGTYYFSQEPCNNLSNWFQIWLELPFWTYDWHLQNSFMISRFDVKNTITVFQMPPGTMPQQVKEPREPYMQSPVAYT